MKQVNNPKTTVLGSVKAPRVMDGGKQNVTLSLPKPLLRRIKVLAARLDKSISELLTEALQARLAACGSYEQTKRRQLKLLEKGFDLGTAGKLLSREEMHARRR